MFGWLFSVKQSHSYGLVVVHFMMSMDFFKLYVYSDLNMNVRQLVTVNILLTILIMQTQIGITN